MRVLRFILILVISALAGLAFGFALRSRAHARHTDDSHISQVRLLPSGEPARSPATRTNALADFSSSTSLETNLVFSHGVTQWLYWMEAIEKATTNDMPRLAQLARQNPAALRMVGLRWMELNPRHLFDALARAGADETLPFGTLSEILLDEWIKRDPAALIAALKESPPFGARGSWRSRISGKVIEKDAELGIHLMEKWREDHYTPNMDGVAKWAAADPQHAAEFIFAHHAGNVSQAAAGTIGSAWAKMDPAAALEFALSKPGELPELLANSALKTWAERDLSSAADWLAQADRTTRNRLGAPFAEAWAAKDPASALVWAEANLTGSSLANASGTILKSAAEKDTASAARLVNVMQPSPARAAAAVSVAAKWLPAYNSENAPTREALAWMENLDPESIRQIMQKQLWQWGEYDPRGMAQFLTSHPVSNVESRVYEIVARNLARTDPRAALEWASSTPDYARAATGGEAFAQWRRSQPEAALEWWNGLSPEEPRRNAYLESALRDLVWDDHGQEQFAALAALDPRIARTVVEKQTSLSSDRRASLLRIADAATR